MYNSFYKIALLFAAALLAGLNLTAHGNDSTAVATRGLTRVETVYSEPRVALVIGNSDYVNAPLLNPVNDARAIDQALRAVGFDVAVLTNASHEQMAAAIREFGAKLIGEGGVALVFFAGHGMQVNGSNYLLPVGSKLDAAPNTRFKPLEVGLSTITVRQVLREMDETDNRVNILILDACRNNPYARNTRAASQGLAEIKSKDTPRGTLIAFATAPGDVASDGEGNNSVYTKHLLKHIYRPGLSLEKLFKEVRVGVTQETSNQQTPWENTSMTGDFYFLPSNNPIAAQPADDSNDDSELLLWRKARALDQPYMYQAYLSAFPNGHFIVEAKHFLKRHEQRSALDTPPEPTVAPIPTATPAPSATKSSSPRRSRARRDENIWRALGKGFKSFKKALE